MFVIDVGSIIDVSLIWLPFFAIWIDFKIGTYDAVMVDLYGLRMRCSICDVGLSMNSFTKEEIISSAVRNYKTCVRSLFISWQDLKLYSKILLQFEIHRHITWSRAKELRSRRRFGQHFVFHLGYHLITQSMNLLYWIVFKSLLSINYKFPIEKPRIIVPFAVSFSSGNSRKHFLIIVFFSIDRNVACCCEYSTFLVISQCDLQDFRMFYKRSKSLW